MVDFGIECVNGWPAQSPLKPLVGSSVLCFAKSENGQTEASAGKTSDFSHSFHILSHEPTSKVLS